MLKSCLFVVLAASSTVWASGWGDSSPIPTPPPVPQRWTYTCTLPDSKLSVQLEYLGVETHYFPFQKVAIDGLNENIRFQTNATLQNSIAEKYETYLEAVPNQVANGSFNFANGKVSGFGFYRSSMYHIGIFSSQQGRSSETMDIFVYDLVKGIKQSHFAIPCLAKIQSVVP